MTKKSTKSTEKQVSPSKVPAYTGVGSFVSVLYELEAFKKTSTKKSHTGGFIWN